MRGPVACKCSTYIHTYIHTYILFLLLYNYDSTRLYSTTYGEEGGGRGRNEGRNEGRKLRAAKKEKGTRKKEKAGREASEYTSIVRVCEAMWGKYNRVI